MRRGRAIHGHPRARQHGDDWLMSARIIVALLETSETTIRRKLEPVARDELTGVLLYSAKAAEALWPARPEIDLARATRQVVT